MLAQRVLGGRLTVSVFWLVYNLFGVLKLNCKLQVFGYNQCLLLGSLTVILVLFCLPKSIQEHVTLLRCLLIISLIQTVRLKGDDEVNNRLVLVNFTGFVTGRD